MPTPSIDRIVLTGFMGSGKSTVGPLLAARLGWRFLDLDAVIEEQEGISVAAIFATKGEPYFRSLEIACLTGALSQPRLVLGLGGGIVESPESPALLTATPDTAIVYLAAPLEVLLTRCQAQDALAAVPGRPLLTEAASRFAGRVPLYEQISHYTVPVAEAAPDLIATRILTALDLPVA